MAGRCAWLCDQLWDRYQFSGDKKYLKDIYPVMRGAAQFFLDTLVEDPANHWLVTCSSVSPENQHPFDSAACAGPAMDEEILRDLLSNCIEASNVLDTDSDFRKDSCRNGLAIGCASASAAAPPHFPFVCFSPPRKSRHAARRSDRLGHRLAHQLLGATA